MAWPDRFYTQLEDFRRQIQWFAWLVLVGLVAGLILNLFWHGEEMAKRVVCASHLKDLGMALTMYSDENDGLYPTEDRWAIKLIPYIDGLYVYFCPSDDQIRFMRRRKQHELPISYWYREPVIKANRSTTRIALAGDRMLSNMLGNHKDGGNVVYLDGHASWRTLEMWSKQGLPTETIIDWKKLSKSNKMPYATRPPARVETLQELDQ